jgi:hypothetical protein
MNGDELFRLDTTTVDGAPRDRHRLDQCALGWSNPAGKLVGHRAAHDGELRQAPAAAVVAMKGQQAAVVVLSRATEQAASAGLHRFHGDEVPDLQILNAIAATNDDATQLMAEDDGVLDPGERMRIAPRSDWTVVVFVQVAAADSVVLDMQLDLVEARHRFGHIFEPKILSPIEDCRTHARIFDAAGQRSNRFVPPPGSPGSIRKEGHLVQNFPEPAVSDSQGKAEAALSFLAVYRLETTRTHDLWQTHRLTEQAHVVTRAPEDERAVHDVNSESHADAASDVFLEPGRAAEPLGRVNHLREVPAARIHARRPGRDSDDPQ